MMWAGHRAVVDDGNWYYNDDHDGGICDNKNHVDDLRKGVAVAVLKTEPTAVAEAVKVAEVAAVATARADNNNKEQQK